MSAPDVSVIVPTHRRERLVVEAVQSALTQEGVSVEVLVLDDSPEGSARAAVEAIGDPRVRYHVRAEPSRGRPAVVRNEGIWMARGRHLYFLDDDDHVLPGGLAALASALDRTPAAGVAYGRVVAFGTDPAIVASYERWWSWADRVSRRVGLSSWLTAGVILFRGTLLINSACMMRTSCARELGGYDGAIPVYEDVEFHTRGIRRFGHVFVDHPVLHYRTGAPSLIHDLKGDTGPIRSSYAIIHRKYRQAHGELEYRALQLVSKLLPLAVPAQGRS